MFDLTFSVNGFVDVQVSAQATCDTDTILECAERTIRSKGLYGELQRVDLDDPQFVNTEIDEEHNGWLVYTIAYSVSGTVERISSSEYDELDPGDLDLGEMYSIDIDQDPEVAAA